MMNELTIRLEIKKRLPSREALAVFDANYFIAISYKNRNFKIVSKEDRYILGVYTFDEFDKVASDYLKIYSNIKDMANLEGLELPSRCRGDIVNIKYAHRVIEGIIIECHSDGSYRIHCDLERGNYYESTINESDIIGG